MKDTVRTLSPSAMDAWSACQRKGWFRAVQKIRTPQSPAAVRGDQLHKAAEHYLQGLPDWRSLPFSEGALVAQPLLPAPNTVEIELWAPRVPLAPQTVFTGRVDMLSTPESRHGRPLLAVDGHVLADADTLWIGDHKSKSSNKYLYTSEQLAEDVQMLAYASSFQRAGLTAATKVSVAHFYYIFRKDAQAGDTPQVQRVCARVSQAALDANWASFERVAAIAEPLYDVQNQDDVPANLARCGDYGGCDFAGVCTAAKMAPRRGLASALAAAPSRIPAPLTSRVVDGPRRPQWHDYNSLTQGEKPVALPFTFKGGFKPSTPAQTTAEAQPAAQAPAEAPAQVQPQEPAREAPADKSAVVPPDAPSSITPSIQQWVEFNGWAKGQSNPTEDQILAKLHALSLPTQDTFVRAAVASAAGMLVVPGAPNPYATAGNAAAYMQRAWDEMKALGVQALPIMALAKVLGQSDVIVSTIARAISTSVVLSGAPLLVAGDGVGAWLYRNPDWDGQPVYVVEARKPVSEAAKEAFGGSSGVTSTASYVDKNNWHEHPAVVERFQAYMATVGHRAGKLAPVVKDIVNSLFGAPGAPHVSSVRGDRIAGLAKAAGYAYDEATGVVSLPADAQPPAIAQAPAPAQPPAIAQAPAPAQVAPTPAPAPAPKAEFVASAQASVSPSAFPATLYVGCWPEDIAVRDLLTSPLLTEAVAKVEADEGVMHYSLIKFAQGPAQVAALVKFGIRQGLADMRGDWFLTRREDALTNALIPIFKAAGWRIVRPVG